MAEQARVTRLRQVFGDVVAVNLVALQASIDEALSEVAALRLAAQERPAAYPITRRRVLQAVQQKTKHYHLRDEVRFFTLVAADAETPAGLDLAQLEALDHWLDAIVDRYQHACDSPDDPPAR